MNKAKVYETLPYDLSGSRSKNRFRNELLWGLEKLYEIYKSEEDFFMIFDYVCDIEIHFTNRFEFYQIKTSNKGEAYTIGKISNPDKQGNSILGKVYSLKKIIDDSKQFESTKIAIVVNVPLKTLDENIHSSVKELSLNDITDLRPAKKKADRVNGDMKIQSKNKIINNLKAEINSRDIDLSNVYYINSSLDLINPENTLLGLTLKFVEEITGKQDTKVRTLYRILIDTITEKACYELKFETYDEIKRYKGISKTEFKCILDRYTNISENYVQKAKQLIEQNYTNYTEKIKILKGLSRMFILLKTSLVVSNLKDKILHYIDGKIDNLGNEFKEIIDNIVDVFNEEFPIEYLRYERIALIILIMAKYEEDLNG